jgi:Holliday junction resolvasome RuvABC endonuclease subunit
MIHVGIDIGIRKLAIGMPQMPYAASLDLGRPGRYTREDELLTLAEWLTSEVDDTMGLWVEMPYLSNGPKANQTTTVGMAETVGMVRSASRWHSLVMVGQSTWKAEVLGYGAADKTQVALWLKENEPTKFLACAGEDEMDAMCLGMYGVLRAEGAILPPEARERRRSREKVRGRIEPSVRQAQADPAQGPPA